MSLNEETESFRGSRTSQLVGASGAGERTIRPSWQRDYLCIRRTNSQHLIDCRESHGMLSPLTVRAFGGFEVRSEVGLAKWISKKSMELFAYLLIQRGRPVSKSRIIEHIYTDTPQKNAATYVNTNVYQLRKTLHALGHKNIIVHSQEQYWLLLDQVEIDFVQFEDQVSQFTAMESDHFDKALACEQLYTAELFEVRSFEWSITEQIRLHNLYARFVKQLSRSLITHQRAEQAAPLIKKLLLSDEWDEEANLLLLQAYIELNDHPSFAQHYVYSSNLYYQELSLPFPHEFSEMYA